MAKGKPNKFGKAIGAFLKGTFVGTPLGIIDSLLPNLTANKNDPNLGGTGKVHWYRAAISVITALVALGSIIYTIYATFQGEDQAVIKENLDTVNSINGTL